MLLKKLTVRATGRDRADLEWVLEEVLKLMRAGYSVGNGAHVVNRFKFVIEDTECALGDARKLVEKDFDAKEKRNA